MNWEKVSQCVWLEVGRRRPVTVLAEAAGFSRLLPPRRPHLRSSQSLSRTLTVQRAPPVEFTPRWGRSGYLLHGAPGVRTKIFAWPLNSSRPPVSWACPSNALSLPRSPSPSPEAWIHPGNIWLLGTLPGKLVSTHLRVVGGAKSRQLPDRPLGPLGRVVAIIRRSLVRGLTTKPPGQDFQRGLLRGHSGWKGSGGGA